QKTSWFLNHRIRKMLTENAPELLDGIVEVDECYIGGLESNKHKSKRKVRGGAGNKSMVLSAIQRNGKLRTKVIAKTNTENVEQAIQEFISPNSTMVTDESKAYSRVGKKYKHRTINHRNEEYVRQEDISVHTQSIESYWNILRKQIDGIHHYVSPK